MSRKVNDACMFCLGAGCEVCVKPTKKSASRKPAGSRAKPIVDITVETAAGPAKPDTKAAMKSVATSQVSVAKEDEREFLEALVALEPILHPDELARVGTQLDAYKPRAQRWRERREQLG